MLRSLRSASLFVLVASGFAFFQAPDAQAYFDPASGSLILQMILGGIAGVALMVRIYWHKLLGLFGVQTADPTEESEGDDEGDDEDID
ncbi:MAG: hypothetical protein MPN21_26370 [Thermoanaerobaculia bacterium]|nr:hypothetical protein [Thermoanaerobaculia bacterium]